nr:uncharacterized protein LOC109179941 [Ipomoea batatas]
MGGADIVIRLVSCRNDLPLSVFADSKLKKLLVESLCKVPFKLYPGDEAVLEMVRFDLKDLASSLKLLISGQRWLLPELPRRKSKEETQKDTFVSDDSSDHTNIPYEETPPPNMQSSPQSPIPQPGAVQFFNAPLSMHEEHLLHIDKETVNTSPTSGGNPIVPWTTPITSIESTGLKRKKPDFGLVQLANFVSQT